MYQQPIVQKDEFSPMAIICASVGNGGKTEDYTDPSDPPGTTYGD